MSADHDPSSDYSYDLAHELSVALRLPMRRVQSAVSVPAQILRREHMVDGDASDPVEV